MKCEDFFQLMVQGIITTWVQVRQDKYKGWQRVFKEERSEGFGQWSIVGNTVEGHFPSTRVSSNLGSDTAAVSNIVRQCMFNAVAAS